MATNKMSPSF